MQTDILAAYPTVGSRYDELLRSGGAPRAHWTRLCDALRELSLPALRTRLDLIAREIRDSGITYNVYADPQGLDRPWDLDCLPLILPPEEWHAIETGVAQRARVMNLILADLYGEQRLLRDGLLPPSLILGHSGFLRPVCGLTPPDGIFLHHYAVDLARSPDGRWWAVADRSQAPSGAGYALENRLMVSRVFPDLFHELQVTRLAGYFAALRDALCHYAPRGDDQALVVVLTPGPYNETYFEHSFLARYLGFPLVEGGDLVVRKGCVWLKTLEGLRRVHAILRRQDDAFCDPLELRADSALGVPGLTDCARRGNVVIANALGAGVLESGALLGFLPAICETLCDETLSLPSVATWWCGEDAALRDVLTQLDRLVFKPADPAYGFEPVFGEDLDRSGRAAFVRALRAAPARYLAQELVHVSQAPVLVPGPRLAARGIGLRVFAVATPDGYCVMPGGLTRVASVPDPRVLSNQRGGSSKDTWVITAERPERSTSLLAGTGFPRQTMITSRVAEHLYWFGRYAERCDDTARLLRTGLQAEVDGSSDVASAVAALAARTGLLNDAPASTHVWCDAANDADNPASLRAVLRQLSRVAFGLRERMSLDHWRAISQLVHDATAGRDVGVAETLAFSDRTVTGLMTLAGFTLDGMTRDLGWRFVSLGRRVERLTFLTEALEVALDDRADISLNWLLEIADSIVTFRARYMAQPTWPPLLELLVFDPANPRSLMFQIAGIDGYLQKLAAATGEHPAPRFAEAGSDLAALQTAPLEGDKARLRGRFAAVRAAALDLNDRLTQRYFTHAGLSGQATLAS